MSTTIAAEYANVAALGASELHASYRAGALSPVQALEAVLARITALDPVFNAFRLVDAAGARAQARAAEARWRRGAALGPLDGIPVTVKDLLHVRGWPTRMGSLATDDAPAAADAPAVARLRAAGVVLLGKTQTSEFGARGLTESALGGVTRNPWNPAYSCLGSSGGAAAAAALNLGPLHLATDGGGSIRAPAAACGVFGFKPSFGRVPVAPAAHTRSLFHVGAIARSPRDAALMLDALAPLPGGPTWAGAAAAGVAGLRVAYCGALGGAPVDAELEAAAAAAVRVLAQLGMVVVAAQPDWADHRPLMQQLWETGAARLLRGIPPARHALLDAGLRAAAGRGDRVTVADHRAALHARRALRLQVARWMESVDLIAGPVLSQPPPPVGTPSSAPACSLFNLTGQPSASIPCGFTAAGLPIALQLAGPRGGDLMVLRAAHALEAARPWSFPAR